MTFFLQNHNTIIFYDKKPPKRRFFGGAKGSRTPDLLNAIQTRYQLRYNPSFFHYSKFPSFCQPFFKLSLYLLSRLEY